MPYYIAIYDWSLFTLPGALTMANIEGATYGHGTPSWLGETFTYNGGSSSLLEINDDDLDFQDGYVETGGPQTLGQDVTINGTTYLAGSVVENEFSMLDASGDEIWVVRIDGVNVGFAYPSGEDPTPGQTFTGTVGRDGDPADSQDGVGTSEPYSGIICFTPGTLIETPKGPRPVEKLKIGDPVRTLDSGNQAIRWISHRRIEFHDDLETAKPVLIQAGALSKGLPKRSIVVSPQHRFIFRLHGNSSDTEVLVPAKALTDLQGIRMMTGKRAVEYIHIALDKHEVILAEGVYTESCYMGPVALQEIPRHQRSLIKSIFPQIQFDLGTGYGPTARPSLKVQEARKLLKSKKLDHQVARKEFGRVFTKAG